MLGEAAEFLSFRFPYYFHRWNVTPPPTLREEFQYFPPADTCFCHTQRIAVNIMVGFLRTTCTTTSPPVLCPLAQSIKTLKNVIKDINYQLLKGEKRFLVFQGFPLTEPRKDISSRTWSGSPELLAPLQQFISSFLAANTRLHFCLPALQGPPPMGRKMRTYSRYGTRKTHWVFNDFQAESCCESDAQSQQRIHVQDPCNKIKITNVNL